MGLFDSLRRLLGRGSTDAAIESWTIGNPGAQHPYGVGPTHPAAKYLEGMSFCATFQVRTPLRILKRHGKALPLGSELPNDFEPWMGIWIPKPRSFRELGIDLDEPDWDSTVASPAGPVKPSEYLPFLIAVRQAVEDSSGGLRGRLARLEAVSARPEFSRFVTAEGGVARLSDRLFPPFLSSIPSLPSNSRADLVKLGLSTAGALRAAPDHLLLTVKGIGPAKLEAIRERCAKYRGDPDAERLIDLAI